MSWSPLTILGVSFLSPTKKPAYLEFRQGLNVVCGASDTGKSFVVEAIDFMLATTTGRELRDIPERVGYDRLRMTLKTSTDETYTLQRAVSGGNYLKFAGDWLTEEPDFEGAVLRTTPTSTNNETVSTFFLSQINLADKYVRKNSAGETRRLGFRNLVRMVLVEEEKIIRQSSPLVSEQVVQQTADYATFKLLLTGVDDSALTQAPVTHEPTTSFSEINSKVEFIDELLQELRTEVGRFGHKDDIEHRLSLVEIDSNKQQKVLNQLQQTLNELLERRQEILRHLDSVRTRQNEISGLLSRFDLLREHYKVDLERLAAIEESGSLFVLFDKKSCPLCGAHPDDQHLGDACDGNVENVVASAQAEGEKVKILLDELNGTITDLRAEFDTLQSEKSQIEPEFQRLNSEIEEIVLPLKDVQNSFSEVIKESGEIQRILDKFDRLESLEKKKAALLQEIQDAPVDGESDIATSSNVELSATVADQFAQKVQDLLQTWHFPGAERVHFEERLRDIIIDGKPRASRGKGLRAITHAAMTIGLMEFCRERNLPHPGFVILDSPLLAYYEPEGAEDSLEGTDLKEKFYGYLANNLNDSQVIVIENQHPPIEIQEEISFYDFTKNPHGGRYGFFPPVMNIPRRS